MFGCEFCNYGRHAERRHANETKRAPTTMYGGENVEHTPNSVFVGNDVYQDQSSSNQNNTSGISQEAYNHALDCINSWKNAHDNLARSNQTGLVENRNWQMSHQK